VLPAHHKLSKDEQWLSIVLTLTYLGQLTLEQMSRLLLTPSRTLQRRLTQDDDSLVRRGLVQRLDQADFDDETAHTERSRSYWQLTDEGMEYIKRHEQFPVNVLGQDTQYPAKLNTIRKGTIQHDRWVAEAVICLIEYARDRLGGLSGIFVRFEMKMTPFRPAPIADAIVVIHAETDKGMQCHPLPFTRDMPTTGEYFGTFTLEIDMGTEPRSTIRGKAESYGMMLSEERWQQQWVARFGGKLTLLWIVPTPHRRDDIRDIWIEQLPNIRFFIATFDEVQHNRWQRYSNGQIDEVMLFPRINKALPPPAEPASSPALPPPASRAALPPPTSAALVVRRARVSDEQEAVITPEQRQRALDLRLMHLENEARQKKQELARQEAETRQRTVRVSVTDRRTGEPMEDVEVLVGTGEAVRSTARTDANGIASVSLSEPLDRLQRTNPHWWSVPAARRREPLANYVIGETLQVQMDDLTQQKGPPPLHHTISHIARRGARDVWHTLTEVAQAGGYAFRIPSLTLVWSYPISIISMSNECIHLLLWCGMSLLEGAIRLLVHILYIGCVIVWYGGLSILRLSWDALRLPWEWQQWHNYAAAEEKAWETYRQEHRWHLNSPSRETFDRARLAYRPAFPQRSKPRIVMSYASLLLLLLIGCYLGGRSWEVEPVVAWWAERQRPSLSVPTQTATPLPAPALAAICGQARVTSYRLNVRNAPYGEKRYTLRQNDLVEVRCTAPVERNGFVWVEIVPLPGMGEPAWVAQEYLVFLSAPQEE
jgi:hypothetical protein